MNQKILIGLSIAAVSIGLITAIVLSQSNSEPSSKVVEGATSTLKMKQISKEEVSKHTARNDCWTIIRGKVYDLTSYVSNHSGGDEILRACGIDATTLFERRETDSGEEVGSGTPHSSSAARDLQRLQIGTLTN